MGYRYYIEHLDPFPHTWIYLVVRVVAEYLDTTKVTEPHFQFFLRAANVVVLTNYLD